MLKDSFFLQILFLFLYQITFEAFKCFVFHFKPHLPHEFGKIFSFVKYESPILQDLIFKLAMAILCKVFFILVEPVHLFGVVFEIAKELLKLGANQLSKPQSENSAPDHGFPLIINLCLEPFADLLFDDHLL